METKEGYTTSYFSHLDTKGRCAFPFPIRKWETMYLIFDPAKGRAIAIPDITLLRTYLPTEIALASIPVSTKKLNFQGKITFGSYMLNQLIPYGHTWKSGDQIGFMVSPKNENIVEIYFTPRSLDDLKKRQYDIAKKVIDILMEI